MSQSPLRVPREPSTFVEPGTEKAILMRSMSPGPGGQETLITATKSLAGWCSRSRAVWTAELGATVQS